MAQYAHELPSTLSDIPLVEAVPVGPYKEPIIRDATVDDADSLARIELSAYRDVYGEDPTPESVEAVRAKYRERVTLLDGLVSVLEDDTQGVYGVMVCCTTNLTKEDLLTRDLDMTDNRTIREVYDPTGSNGYVVNLAVLPRHGARRDSTYLFANALQKAQALDVHTVYFESRMPGFEHWRQQQCAQAEAAHREPPSTDDLAEAYWQATRGNGKPIDPLMRMYSDMGAEPLRLITGAWKPDKSSNGYGVLYEYNLNQASLDTPAVEQVVHTSNASVETPDAGTETWVSEQSLAAFITVEGKPDGKNFFQKALEWAKTHKKQVALLGSAVVGLAYVMATGGESQIISRVSEDAPWALPAYAASLATYFAGGAMMAAAAGRKVVGSMQSSRSEQTEEALQNAGTSWLLRAGLWVNTIGGVSAAVVAGTGIVEAVPFGPGMWSLLAVPTIDFYSTLASRSVVFRAMRDRQTLPSLAPDSLHDVA